MNFEDMPQTLLRGGKFEFVFWTCKIIIGQWENEREREGVGGEEKETEG